MQYLINRCLRSESFKVDDPPNVADVYLNEVANFLSFHLQSDGNFNRFADKLLPQNKTGVLNIRDTQQQRPDKCLALLELWITTKGDAKWLDLRDAANACNLGGVARTLTGEFGKWVEIGGNYKHIINCVVDCSYFYMHNVHVACTCTT